MTTSFDRSGRLLSAGDFAGSVADSPSGNFSVGWYCTKTRGMMDEKNYVLLQGTRPVITGAVMTRIFDAKASDCGLFALQLIGKSGATSLRVFAPSGEELFSKDFREGIRFYDLSPDGKFLFWCNDNCFECADVVLKTVPFGFEVEHPFDPTGANMEQDGASVVLQHAEKGWYRFSRDGEFLDREAWFHDYIKDCTGLALYQAIRDLHQRQGISDAQEAASYAEWIEEALRRGIESTFSLKLATVYEYLAELYTASGNADRALGARSAMEEHLDGFQLVNRVTARLRNIGSPVNRELVGKLLDDLNKAQTESRVLEYPNYAAKLFRAKGQLLELGGEIDAAIIAYQTALDVNPEAGCRKQLDRLSQSRSKS